MDYLCITSNVKAPTICLSHHVVFYKIIHVIPFYIINTTIKKYEQKKKHTSHEKKNCFCFLAKNEKMKNPEPV